jgi:histone H3/H4
MHNHPFRSGLKETLADHPVSTDFYEAVNDEVGELLTDDTERAEANKRKTIEPQGL